MLNEARGLVGFSSVWVFCVILAGPERHAEQDQTNGENGIQNDRLCISFHVFISSEDSFIIFPKNDVLHTV